MKKEETLQEIDDDKNNYEDFDFGTAIGMEYAISDLFLIEARYYLGISEFFNQSQITSSAKHSVLSIGAAYRF